MKNRFLRLIKLGSSIYLFIAALIVLTIAVSDSKFLGIDNILLFFGGVFIDIIIFSMAMAYKVKLVFMHIIEVRQKISQDLHDDIGASLSSLQIYGAIAEQTFAENPVKAMDMIKKMSSQSKQVMENMNDIVWSMKSNAAATTTLEAKIKNYGVELLSDKNIFFQYKINPETESLLQSMLARKNILLIIKEAMNNIAKYSKATEADLQLTIENGNCILRIKDNGVGFDIQHPNDGNGLMNMQHRALELKGTLTIRSSPGEGTAIRGIFPVEAISGKGG